MYLSVCLQAFAFPLLSTVACSEVGLGHTIHIWMIAEWLKCLAALIRVHLDLTPRICSWKGAKGSEKIRKPCVSKSGCLFQNNCSRCSLIGGWIMCDTKGARQAGMLWAADVTPLSSKWPPVFQPRTMTGTNCECRCTCLSMSSLQKLRQWVTQPTVEPY